jgi:hypothetical protein
MGQLYLFQFPLILLGLVWMLKEQRQRLSFFLLWTVVTILILSLSKEVPHATRGYFLLIPLTVFAAQGFLLLGAWLRKLRHSRVRVLVALLITGLCLYNLVYYFSAFYGRFPRKYAKDWNQQDKALALFLKENEEKYDAILIDNSAGFMYTSLLFYTAYDPNAFQQFAKRAPDDAEGFSRVSAIGKYQWQEIQWKRDLKRRKTLIVTGFNKAPAAARVVKRFRYPQVPIVLSVKEQIAQYPFQEEAYVLVATPEKAAPPVRSQPLPAVGR